MNLFDMLLEPVEPVEEDDDAMFEVNICLLWKRS